MFDRAKQEQAKFWCGSRNFNFRGLLGHDGGMVAFLVLCFKEGEFQHNHGVTFENKPKK